MWAPLMTPPGVHAKPWPRSEPQRQTSHSGWRRWKQFHLSGLSPGGVRSMSCLDADKRRPGCGRALPVAGGDVEWGMPWTGCSSWETPGACRLGGRQPHGLAEPRSKRAWASRRRMSRTGCSCWEIPGACRLGGRQPHGLATTAVVPRREAVGPLQRRRPCHCCYEHFG